MGTELFHTQLLRYGISCQSVYALVITETRPLINVDRENANERKS